MKRKTLKAHLLKAERQVAKGQALVDGQRQLLTSDFLKGEGITDEVELLKQLLEEQRLLIKHRDQLLKELSFGDGIFSVVTEGTIERSSRRVVRGFFFFTSGTGLSAQSY